MFMCFGNQTSVINLDLTCHFSYTQLLELAVIDLQYQTRQLIAQNCNLQVKFYMIGCWEVYR